MGGRRQQMVDDVGGRQRLVELTQEDVDVQTSLAVQQVDLSPDIDATTINCEPINFMLRF